MSNAAIKFLTETILSLESRAMVAGTLSRDGLRLLRAAATYRASQTMRGVWLP